MEAAKGCFPEASQSEGSRGLTIGMPREPGYGVFLGGGGDPQLPRKFTIIK